MQVRDAAWRWSEAFVKAADCSIRDRPLDAAELPDWHEHCARLARWQHDIEQARKKYLEGHPAQLRYLYSFWHSLGPFRLWKWRPSRVFGEEPAWTRAVFRGTQNG
jgi:hypothetical protein